MDETRGAPGLTSEDQREGEPRRRSLTLCNPGREKTLSALKGIRVLDFSRVLAGPYSTMILSDLGAEVIKVERMEKGDLSRDSVPFVNEQSAYFISVNRGKKSITLNLKEPEGRDVAARLADRSDIVVENFRPGVMDRLGLGAETLRKRNPRLIYASVTGFGQTGPYAQRPAYDLILQSMGGLVSITGSVSTIS